MRLRITILGLLAALAIAASAPAAFAKPAVGTPRTIEAKVGQEGILRLMSNALKGEHWIWLKKPKAPIAFANPPEQLPENDEAVNGLAGRTAVSVRGRRPGRTTGLIGYYTRHQRTLIKTVALTIIVR